MDRQNLANMISRLSDEATVDLVWEISRASDEAERALLSFFEKRALPDEQTMLHDRRLWMLWNEAEEVIDEANEYGGCSKHDEECAYDNLYFIEQIVLEQPTSPSCRADLLDKVLDAMFSDEGMFEDSLFDLAKGLCIDDEEKRYLAERLLESSGFRAGVGAGIMRELGYDDAYLAYRKDHLCSEGEYLDLIGYYDEKGRHDLALGLAEEAAAKGLAKERLFAYLLDEYRESESPEKAWKLYRELEDSAGGGRFAYWFGKVVESMYEFCTATSDTTNRDDILVKAVSCCESSKVREWYDRCASLLAQKRFEKEKPKLLEVIRSRNKTAYLDICMDEGMTKEVLDTITEQKGFPAWNHPDAGHRYSMQLEKVYPKEIARYYWEEARRLTGASSRDNYQACVKLLNRIQPLMEENGMKSQWRAMYASFLEQHSRKRLLMGYIDDFGPARP